MKIDIPAGSLSQSVNLFIQDSSSTVGAGLTGLVFNTSNLVASYTFTGANCARTAISLATLAAVGSAYSGGGFKEIDATNTPGLYRFDIPDAALAISKGRSVTIMLKGASNMAPCPLEITFKDNVIPIKVTGTCTVQTVVDSTLSAYKSLAGRVLVWSSGSANFGSQVLITAHTDAGTTLTTQTMGTVPASGDLANIY